MANIISILNQKGGSGKTTTCVNLAACLTEKGRKVLLIDLDPQASCSKWCGFESQDKPHVYELLTSDISINKIVYKYANGLNLAPATMKMSNLEKILAREIGAEFLLKNKLSKIHATQYDYILLDCPPSLGLLSVSALIASNEIIIPVSADFMALEGIKNTLKILEEIKEKQLNPSLKIKGILICKFDKRTALAKEVETKTRKHFGGQVFDTIINQNTKLGESPASRQPIITYATRSTGARDYRAFTLEMLNEQ